MNKESKKTDAARRRYNRVAPFYDFIEGMIERPRHSIWRETLWSKVEDKKVLEVGVGTGKNFPYYPVDKEIVAIDFSERMLDLARKKAKALGIKVYLEQMDVQDLKFEDNTFDTVVGSFIFCSTPDPIRGLQEVRRVCKPGGKVLLLEHVLSANRLLAWWMNLVNPVITRLMGGNINRRTVENVDRSGLKIERVADLAYGIFKLIEARKEY